MALVAFAFETYGAVSSQALLLVSRICSAGALQASFGSPGCLAYNSHRALRFVLGCLPVAIQRGNALIAMQGLSMLARSVASSVRSLARLHDDREHFAF